MSLVSDPQRIRLGMAGMVEENGHPFSWSAIINGRYDSQIIRNAGYPMIVDYLDAQAPISLGLPGVEITHIWCDRPEDAQAIARSAKIAHCLDTPTDMIGHVDAVVIPTDKGEEHLDRARPFVNAGLPVFIDKPLTTRLDHLKQFIEWHNAGKHICSSSAMRYAHEFRCLRQQLSIVGQPRLIVATCAKSWERYGIHAIEAVYGLLPSGGWIDVCNVGNIEANIVHIRHAQPVNTVIAVVNDMFGGFCHVTVYGTTGRIDARFTDSFTAFKSQLQAFIEHLRGTSSIDFAATIEQMKIVVAGIRSRERGGQRQLLSQVNS
ncbi:MAG TPA: Gfo/Idh/MocA family oxidoreductase [Lacipirellulaceae bacterium]|nr:Gfo/Idh/MocA family oxidoreductase [Lacipirellulaceae bacterium]